MELTSPLLHTWEPLPKTWINRVFALVYSLAFLTLLHRDFSNVLRSPTLISTSIFLADLVLAFMWTTCQTLLLNPIRRQVFPENLPKVASESEYPGLDVFVCTADLVKEPPMGVVNTALSVLAYDYPTDKLSVYVSDDGGSQLTLFAFMEAAKFAKYWLPYCKKYNIMDRSPAVYFSHNPTNCFPETNEIKLMYETMKTKVEKTVKRGTINRDLIDDESALRALDKWTSGFTCQNHPTVIEVLLDSNKNKDIVGHAMPNLIYVSREKSKVASHHYKAGALNTLIRVSGNLTNAPIFLVLDCDMYSNDPRTPLRALCFLMDPKVVPELAFIQFPQRFHDVNKNDTYGAEFRMEVQVHSLGMEGYGGTQFMGTGGFFQRKALLGGTPLSIDHVVKPQTRHHKSMLSEHSLALAHPVADCRFEENTKWGSEMGFRYGCLVEDVYTGYHLHCKGWRSILCNPERAAFLGNAPMTLNDVLHQLKRWYTGFLEMCFCKYSPITYGIRSMNPLKALAYTHYSVRSILSIPIIIYTFLPQLALANSVPIFPKTSDPRFILYVFLFLGGYTKDCLDFMLAGGMIKRWWNTQRMWLILGVSTYPFSLFEWSLKSVGISTISFNVTSKVVDDELSKRYENGLFEFGVASLLFYPISVAALISLFSFLQGTILAFKNGSFEELFGQIFIAGFGVVNSWPVYEAMVLRSDKGKMPLKVTLISIGVATIIYSASSLAF